MERRSVRESVTEKMLLLETIRKCKQEGRNGMGDCKCQENKISEAVCLENDRLSVKIKFHGAEMCSIINKENGKQYLWSGDPEFWGRTSPILFPFVGSLRNKEYRYKEKSYPMSQHGFARDMDFELTEQKQDEVWFRLEDTEETYEKYPFHFHLDIGYRLQENQITVLWRVKNLERRRDMYFSIGAHPAFACPLDIDNERSDYFLQFKDGDGECLPYFESRQLGSDGLVVSDTACYPSERGVRRIEEMLFDGDTLILENHQAKEISLLHPTKKPYVTVNFDTPLAGIWTPPKKNAPFVCIEPWYGRCDSSKFRGDLTRREWGNKLKPGEIFEASYSITIEKEIF